MRVFALVLFFALFLPLLPSSSFSPSPSLARPKGKKPRPKKPKDSLPPSDRHQLLTIFKIAPKQLSISVDGSEVWASELYEARVTILDAHKLTVKKILRIKNKGEPTEVVHSPDGKEAWISILNHRRIEVYDMKTHALTHTIPTGNQPKGIAFSLDGKWALATNWRSHDATVIDRRSYKRLREIRTSKVPRGVIFRPDSKEVWVASFTQNIIDIFSVPSFQLVHQIKGLPKNPRHFAQLSDGSKLFVTTNSGGRLAVIDPKERKVLSLLRTGLGQRTITLSPDERHAYVANYYAKTVSVIRLSDLAIVETIPTDRMCIGMVLTPDGKKLFVTNYNMYRVMVFQTPPSVWTRK